MARDFNQIRNTNAKLGSGTVIGYGNHWSLVDELDGWNKVYVGTPNLPNNIKEYLEGNTTLSVYATPQNVDKLHQYAFAGFPNLIDLYLLKEEEIVELDDNFLGGVSNLQHIYVPSDLLGDSSIQDTYLGEYNGKSFASLFTAIPNVLEWTITPSEIGSDTLNEENFNAYISTLTDRIKNAVGQLNLNEFTNGVDFAWSYDFSNVFPNLVDIYVDNVKVDFSTWTIQDNTQDHILTASVVSNSISIIGSDKLSGILEIIIEDSFEEESVLQTIQENYSVFNALSNLNDIYYGNKKIVNNKTREYLFVFDNTETNLTKNIVDNFLTNEANKNNIKKLIISKEFTTTDNYSCTSILSGNLELSNLEIIDTGILKAVYLLGKARKKYNYICNYLDNINGYFYGSVGGIASCITPIGKAFFRNADSTSINILAPYDTSMSADEMYFNNANLLPQYSFRGDCYLEKLFIPKLQEIKYEDGGHINSVVTKMFVSSDTINCRSNINISGVQNLYLKADRLKHFMTKQYISNYASIMKGVIDGNNVYQNIGFNYEYLDMNYPKLTGIDTEANIQLLTPSDNALYIASDTGNLWQYSSGAWTNLFSGYTPTWYSDENCTTTIQPSAITSDMTIYVKLS